MSGILFWYIRTLLLSHFALYPALRPYHPITLSPYVTRPIGICFAYLYNGKWRGFSFLFFLVFFLRWWWFPVLEMMFQTEYLHAVSTRVLGSGGCSVGLTLWFGENGQVPGRTGGKFHVSERGCFSALLFLSRSVNRANACFIFSIPSISFPLMSQACPCLHVSPPAWYLCCLFLPLFYQTRALSARGLI